MSDCIPYYQPIYILDNVCVAKMRTLEFSGWPFSILFTPEVPKRFNTTAKTSDLTECDGPYVHLEFILY